MKPFIDLCNLFLDNQISFDEFEKRWYHLHFDSGLSFTIEQGEILEEINYRNSFTANSDREPDDEEKANGIMSANEFREWLKEEVKKL